MLANELYEHDFFAWTQAQAAALRRMAEARINSELDLAHLALEVEDLGIAQRRGVRSQTRRVIEHLLMLQISPAECPRAGWERTLIEARAQIADTLTPTLRGDLEQQLDELYQLARRSAAAALRARGEQDAAAALPPQCPYALEQILDQDWFPAKPTNG